MAKLSLTPVGRMVEITIDNEQPFILEQKIDFRKNSDETISCNLYPRPLQLSDIEINGVSPDDYADLKTKLAASFLNPGWSGLTTDNNITGIGTPDNPLSLSNVLNYKGVIDCSSNPNYPAAKAGDVYKISVAGKLGGSGGLAVSVGDVFFCTQDIGAGDYPSVWPYWASLNQQGSDATYTPTISQKLNLDSDPAGSCKYIRFGNSVKVYGSLVVKPTASNSTTHFALSIPVAFIGTGTPMNSGVGIAINTNQLVSTFITFFTSYVIYLTYAPTSNASQTVNFEIIYSIT